MKRFSIFAGAIAWAVGVLTVALAQPQRPPTTKEFLWDKLELSEPFLECVMLEKHKPRCDQSGVLKRMSNEFVETQRT